MMLMKIAAVALTILFAAVLVWLYGVKTTLVWAVAMAGFILLLYVVSLPLRVRRRRQWLEMGYDKHGRPLPEEEDEPAPDGRRRPLP